MGETHLLVFPRPDAEPRRDEVGPNEIGAGQGDENSGDEKPMSEQGDVYAADNTGGEYEDAMACCSGYRMCCAGIDSKRG